MESSWADANTAATVVASLISVGSDVALVVVAAMVRKRRPDAGLLLLIWASASLAWSVVGRVLGFVVVQIAARQGIDSMLRVQALTTVLTIPVGVALVILLAVGLLRLARAEA